MPDDTNAIVTTPGGKRWVMYATFTVIVWCMICISMILWTGDAALRGQAMTGMLYLIPALLGGLGTPSLVAAAADLVRK